MYENDSERSSSKQTRMTFRNLPRKIRNHYCQQKFQKKNIQTNLSIPKTFKTNMKNIPKTLSCSYCFQNYL